MEELFALVLVEIHVPDSTKGQSPYGDCPLF
jgi:hypothetical protein